LMKLKIFKNNIFMKKSYIPTSSLNFNNIMSCEAISPVAFYSKRNFGYKIFEKVELNSFDNSVLLFELKDSSLRCDQNSCIEVNKMNS
jgi:hypothetical protein